MGRPFRFYILARVLHSEEPYHEDLVPGIAWLLGALTSSPPLALLLEHSQGVGTTGSSM